MKKVWNLLLFAFFVLCLFLFRPRQDVVFAAIDRSQYIRLFDKGMDFELCIEENQTFTGTYTIMKDTVYLSYREQALVSARNSSNNPRDFRKILPRKLHIDSGTSKIKASDGKAFSAKIYLDSRQKQFNAPSYSIQVLKSQDIQGSGVDQTDKRSFL
jgi:hypothetical protein